MIIMFNLSSSLVELTVFQFFLRQSKIHTAAIGCFKALMNSSVSNSTISLKLMQVTISLFCKAVVCFAFARRLGKGNKYM